SELFDVNLGCNTEKDNTNEMIDIFDANYKHIGVATKDEAHKRGLWHRVIYVWIIKDNGKILLQLRKKHNPNDPDVYDTSAAGHVQVGEGIEIGVRELEEELGVKVAFKDLIDTGYFIWVSDFVSKKGTRYQNREFCHTFFLKDNRSLTEYKMQEEEVEGLFEFDIDDMIKLFENEKDEIKGEGILQGNDKTINRFIRRDDLGKHLPNMWYKVFIIAKRVLMGKKVFKSTI
ncbi:MAG: NUDIX domain-containing protein, partial [Rickettsiales bacterium]|nr:NUDIX domain-containing protein [Rickettsiales bacterium]